jgi:hypothetical protein
MQLKTKADRLEFIRRSMDRYRGDIITKTLQSLNRGENLDEDKETHFSTQLTDSEIDQLKQGGTISVI